MRLQHDRRAVVRLVARFPDEHRLAVERDDAPLVHERDRRRAEEGAQVPRRAVEVAAGEPAKVTMAPPWKGGLE